MTHHTNQTALQAPDRYVPSEVVVHAFRALVVVATVTLYTLASGNTLLANQPGDAPDATAAAAVAEAGATVAVAGR